MTLKPIEHGAPNRYDKCRKRNGRACDACRKQHNEDIKQGNFQRAERLRADPSLAPHGKVTTYTNWMCRCDPCRASAADQSYQARTDKEGDVPPPLFTRKGRYGRRSRITPFGREWTEQEDAA